MFFLPLLLRPKYSNTVFLVCIFPYSVQNRENTDQKTSDYGLVSRSFYLNLKFTVNLPIQSNYVNIHTRKKHRIRKLFTSRSVYSPFATFTHVYNILKTSQKRTNSDIIYIYIYIYIFIYVYIDVKSMKPL